MAHVRQSRPDSGLGIHGKALQTFFSLWQVVYVAPMKALVRERIKDWRGRLVEKLGKRVVELTGLVY